MLNSKRLMAYLLTLLVSFAFIACDGDDCDETAGDAAGEEMSEEEADDSCAEGGDAGGDPAGEIPAGEEGGTPAGEEGGEIAGDMAGETPVVAYDFVVVQDQTEDVNDDGTPGVDICEISVSCGDEELVDGTVSSELGDSGVCDGSNNENCVCVDAVEGICGGTDRSNAALVFNNDSTCDGDDWASTGINGYIALEIDGLNECAASDVSVTVVEKDGPNEESYLVALCASLDNLDYSEMVMGESCLVIGSATASGEQTFP